MKNFQFIGQFSRKNKNIFSHCALCSISSDLKRLETIQKRASVELRKPTKTLIPFSSKVLEILTQPPSEK